MRSSTALDDALRARVVSNLAGLDRHAFGIETLRPAAVALVLVANDAGEACFLLTRRSSQLAHHRMDEGESYAVAARRELHEELGLSLPDSAVLGLLDDFKTRSGYVITPVVMWAGGTVSLTPNPAEVALVYRVPLTDLYRQDVPRLSPSGQSESPILSLPLVGTEVFTPTAAIIYQMREVALEGRATRVHHYDQPLFAWK
jgi:ADP-ribose pyrophosphatase YjhB (NUDIX family)